MVSDGTRVVLVLKAAVDVDGVEITSATELSVVNSEVPKV